MQKDDAVYFIDWADIDKGILSPSFDPGRLTDKGRREVEEFRQNRTIGCDWSMNGHGLIRERIPYGVAVTIEKAEQTGPWMVEDKLWEGWNNYFTVIEEQGIYKCWYQSIIHYRNNAAMIVAADGKTKENAKMILCYAQSADAFNWEKPDLDIYAYKDNKKTNIVSLYGHESAVFRDDSDPGRLYKCFHFDRLEETAGNGGHEAGNYGLYGVYSPDGYHWTKTPGVLVGGFRDTQNVGYYDAQRKKYVGYFRGHMYGRSIERAETYDFNAWPEPETILHPGAQDHPADDYYTNCFTCYPGQPTLQFLFCAVYHHNTDVCDIRMAASHNGKTFNWVSHNPVIEAGNGEVTDIYAMPNLVRLPNGRLGLPFAWRSTTHNEGYFISYYKDYPSNRGFSWAIWEDGRLAGIEAADCGEFHTIPRQFDGMKIQINARTAAAGSVKLELLENNRVIDGFTMNECMPFNGDSIWADCRWKGKKDLAILQGKSLSVHFRLECAKIFAYRFI